MERKQIVRLIDLPKITDPRGNLSFSEYGAIVPFEIERIFWTYDVPGGDIRGGHAYKDQYELIIALSGSFDVLVETQDGLKEVYHMNRSYYGLFLPPLVWRHMENFATNTLALVVSSTSFNKNDYIRDKDEFINLK